MSPDTQIQVTDGVARVSMDDGKVNALSAGLIADLEEALDLAEEAGAVVVLTGREGIFSAGFDLKTFALPEPAGAEMVLAGARLVRRLLAFPFPVLTGCTGHAYPAGAFLMLAADVRIGVSGPSRIGMNEVAIGMTVPEFAIELARHRLTPPGFARVTTAAMWAPEEARELGYLDRVVPPSELAEALDTEAQRLRALDMAAYKGTKARINGLALAVIDSAIERDRANAGL